MGENISFGKSAVGFGLRNLDTTWILSLCSPQISNPPWEIFREEPWKVHSCAKSSQLALGALSSPVGQFGSLPVAGLPHLALWDRALLRLFYVLIMLLSGHPLNRGSTAFHTWINSIMQIVSSPKEIRLWANKKYANKNRKYGSQLRCPFTELWPVVPRLTWSGPEQKGGINRVEF